MNNYVSSAILAPILITLSCHFPSPLAARTVPSLGDILSASEYLAYGDIPEDTSTVAGKTPLFVATNGSDSNDGFSINSPKKHLGAAIEYANAHPATSFVIYLRGGVYYRTASYEYLEIERGNLIITSYSGERAIIRPDFWPNNPTSWGEEVLFQSYGSHRYITISNLTLQGWGVPFVFGTEFDRPPMRDLVIKRIRADEFRKRDPASISVFFSTAYVQRGYFAGRDFDPLDPGIKYQIKGLILSDIYIEGVDMPVNIGDEDDANVKGLRISQFEVRNDPQGTGSTAVDGFAVVNCYKVLIDNCIIDYIEGDGIDAKSFDVCVVNTYLHGIGRNAVKFWHNGEVINSIIYDADADAAFVIEAGPCRMINSVLMKKGAGYAGTYAYDEPSTEKFEVVNSVFIDLDHTFYVGSPDLRSLNSLYFDVPAGLYSGQVSAYTVAELNSLTNCSGNIGADPFFSNPDGEDFTPLPGSPCLNAGIGTGVLLPSFDYYGNPRNQGGGVDIGPVEVAPVAVFERFDYNGDGASDIAVFRPSSGLWAVRGITRLYFGSASDLPVPGDYDGDGTTNIAIFRKSSGLWEIKNLTAVYFGTAADLPVPGDYDGDGSSDLGIFRNVAGFWAIRNLTRFYLGISGDRPLPDDWDGDGTEEAGIFRKANGLWAIRHLSRFYFGRRYDTALGGDYNGDGTREAGIFRPATGRWLIRGLTRFSFGIGSDRPLLADCDGDLADEAGVFREAPGLWAIRGITRLFYGASGDIPVTR